MKLSKKCEYALRALTRLSDPRAPQLISIQELAKREKIPKKFLEQVLLALKKAGILQSSRGKTGGYTLHADPAKVTLGDITRAVDGPLTPLPCVSTAAPVKCPGCCSLENCWLRAVMREVGEGMAAVLDQITVAEICRRAIQSQHKDRHTLTYDI